MIGKQVSHYKILEELGRGGMGVVYKAMDTKLKRQVALKFLPQQALENEGLKSRFANEAQMAAALLHPNIATIFEFEEADGQSFIAMEFVEGETLQHLISGGLIPLDQATEYAIAIADVLSLAHRRGIIHRDIKPGNIMVTPESSEQAGRQIKVLDFGLAKFNGASNATVTGTLVGTLAYMSPEQARGKTVDHRTDIFSWGAVFYEMLAGTAPFVGEYWGAVLYSLMNEEPGRLAQYRENTPEDLEKIVFKALAKNPDQRYQSMGELLTDLTAYQRKPQTLAAKSGQERKSIAVLPFEDISPGKQNEYLADGMTEELVMALSQNRQLRVIARTSVMQYKGQAKDIRNIGRELGVSHLLEGSVRRYDDSLRVTTQLIDATDGSHLWADKFDGAMQNIFAYQEDVAKQVTRALEVQLVKTFRGGPGKPTPHIDAYEYYIESKLLLDTPNLKNLGRAVLTLKRALKLDPSYAAAYGCLGNAYLWYVDAGLRPASEYLSRAQEAAQRALAIDKSQPDALCSLANLTLKKGKVEAAFDGFSKVLETEPNHTGARWWRAILLYNSSFLEMALQEADWLTSSDPFSPLARWLHGTIRLHQGMFDVAVAEYEQVVTEVPTQLVWHALAYRYAGNMTKAWGAARKLKKFEPDGVLWKIAFACLEGAEGKGSEILDYIDTQVREFAWNFAIVTDRVASLYAMVGDRDEALSWLERSITLGNRNHRWFRIDPDFEHLRDDKCYRKLLRKSSLEAEQLRSHFDPREFVYPR